MLVKIEVIKVIVSGKIIKIIGVSIIALLTVTTGAQAALLDFTKNPYIGNNGSIAGTTYSVSSVGGSLSWGQNQDGSTCTGLACQKDGLGIGDDEVTIGSEQIVIDFGAVVKITSFAFLDLFSSSNGNNRERASIAYNGGSIFFDALLTETPGGDSGFLNVSGLSIFTNKLVFTAGGTNDGIGADDYALAAVGVSAVPIPPAILMFGAALGGLGFLGRRKKNISADHY